MDEQAICAVAVGMVNRLAADLSLADRLPAIGYELAQEHGLTVEETAIAFDQALLRLKLLRLRVLHISDQQQAAAERGR